MVSRSLLRCAFTLVASLAIIYLFGSNVFANRPCTSMLRPDTPVSSKSELRPFVVLFTTFSNRADKLDVHSNAIRNWASFAPHVQPVAFTEFCSGPLIDLALAHGWCVLPVPRVNKYGIPFLKEMYLSAIAQFGADFYGFANGDILFDAGLNGTLFSMHLALETYESLFLFGRRHNYDTSERSAEVLASLWQPQRVRDIVHSKETQLFRHDAFDYFFVTPNYPFDELLDLVIARTGYDTYFSARSNQLNVTSIDGTSAISALHQTTGEGNFESEKIGDKDDNRYNRKLIGDRFNYNDGIASQAKYSAELQGDGSVKLQCRKCEKKH